MDDNLPNGFLDGNKFARHPIPLAPAGRFALYGAVRTRSRAPGSRGRAFERGSVRAFTSSSATVAETRRCGHAISPEWKESLVRQVLRKDIPAGKAVLEIGPGAGRWTEFLQPMSASVVGVDISQKCVDLSRDKFRNASNVKFLVTPDMAKVMKAKGLEPAS